MTATYGRSTRWWCSLITKGRASGAPWWRISSSRRPRGGLTVILGSDDEDHMTSLAGVDLYDNLPAKLANIQNSKQHAYEFHLKRGYRLISVVPDANGRGKPDIILGKRIGP